MKVFALMLVAMTSLSSTVLAGSSSGIVTRVYVHSGGTTGDGVVMFKLDNHTDAPECSTAAGGLEWAKSLEKPDGRGMLSALLSAQAQGLNVTVHGMDDCSDWFDRERPKVIIVDK